MRSYGLMAKKVRSRKRTKPGQAALKSGPSIRACSPEDDGYRWTRRCLGVLATVLLVSMVLNSVGLGWGRSGMVPCQPDSIEGSTAVLEMPKVFKQWTYKYPRGHSLINGIFHRQVALFGPEYLCLARTVFGVAGWPVPKQVFISREIHFYKNQSLPSDRRDNPLGGDTSP